MALLAIVFIYASQLLPYFSNTIYEKVRTYRQERQLTKYHLRETKYITLKSWNSIKNKKEFKINGTFYDVFSFEIKNQNTVELIAFKDSQEHKYQLFFNHFLKKNLPNSKDKKKPIQHKIPYTLLENEIATTSFLKEENYPAKNFGSHEGKTVAMINSILKPPTV